MCVARFTTVLLMFPGLRQCCLCCQGYDSVVGNVRKASVYCLVGLHEAVGEEVFQPYLEHVSETKVSQTKFLRCTV